MAFPTTSVLTNFTGSDENPLSEGGNWSGPLLIGRNRWQRLNNQAEGTTGATNQSYWTPATYLETEIFATITAKGTTGAWVDLIARIQAPNTAGADAYELEITSAAGTDPWDLYRIVDAAGTLIHSYTATEVAVGDSIGFEVTGSGATVTCAAYHKPSAGAWTLVGSFGDTNAARITAAGNIGIEQADGGGWALDDFGGGAVVSVPTIPVPDYSRFPKPKLRLA